METFPTSPNFIPDDRARHDFEAQLQLFALAMEPFQEPNWPYHNWEWHIQTSFTEAMRLCDEREKHVPEEPANRLVVALAQLGHDSGYSHYKTEADLFEATGFSSREAYSCRITEVNAHAIGYDPKIIEAAKECIMATKRGMPCQTLEAAIVRRADLFNIASDFEYFKQSTTRFRDEIAMLNHKNKVVDIGEFMCMSWPILRDYIKDDYELWPGERHPWGYSRFYVSACLNIYRMMVEEGITVTSQLTSFVKDLPTKVWR